MPCAVCAPPQSVSSATAHRTAFPVAAATLPLGSQRSAVRVHASRWSSAAFRVRPTRGPHRVTLVLRRLPVGFPRRCHPGGHRGAVPAVGGPGESGPRLGRTAGPPAPKAAFSSLTRGGLGGGTPRRGLSPALGGGSQAQLCSRRWRDGLVGRACPECFWSVVSRTVSSLRAGGSVLIVHIGTCSINIRREPAL